MADATSPVGPYAIVPVAVDGSQKALPNYDVPLVSGTLTVVDTTKPTI